MIRKKSTRGPNWRSRPLDHEGQHSQEAAKQQTEPAANEDQSCKVCGRTFHKPEMLKLHLLTHSMNVASKLANPAPSSVTDKAGEEGSKETMEAPETAKSAGPAADDEIEEQSEESPKPSSVVVTRQASSSSHDMNDSPDEGQGEDGNASGEPEVPKYKCFACDVQCDSQDVLDNHILRQHGARLKCQCQICQGKKRNDAVMLMEEDTVKDGGIDVRIFRCIVCGSVFFLGCKCLCHIEQNHNSIILKYPYECANCGKMFETASFLCEHQTDEHDQLEKLSRCGYCKESFQQTTDLECHINETHQVTKDNFTMTTKDYMNAKYEATVGRSPSRPQPNKPVVTDVVSSSSSGLISRASSSKPYTIAKKSTRGPLPAPSVTSTSSDLNSEDFTCEICNRKSQSRIGYTNHMIVYHKIKPADLPLVMASLVRKGGSRKRRKAHSEDGSSDENWRPSRSKAASAPMRSSIRVALAASRKEVDESLPDQFHDDDDEYKFNEAASEEDIYNKSESPTEEADDMTHSEIDHRDSAEDDGDDEQEDEEDDMDSHSSQEPEESMSDKCKNCPACKEEAVRMAATKAAAVKSSAGKTLTDKIWFKTEPRCDEHGDTSTMPFVESNKQPQIVIRDVFSLHPSNTMLSTYTYNPSAPSHSDAGSHSLTQEGALQDQLLPSTSSAVFTGSADKQCLGCLQSTVSSRCYHCGLVFMDEVMHTIHMGWHGRGDPFDCHACGRKCGDKFTFITHIFRDPHL